MEEQIKVLKEEVRKMLITTTTTNKPMETIYLIDLIQRLGVNYHFEREIDNLLQEIHNTYVENGIITLEEEDLHSLALLFRLLRQEGYRISPDVFNKFKDKEGKFEKRVRSDVKGMLSLYEAAHMRVHGEEILDEAMAFTSNHLKIMLTHKLCEACVVAQINHSLRHPLRKVLPRLEARHYISVYQQHPSHNQTLLMFAKLDFNMLQKLHQREVASITKWWMEDLDVPRKLAFARDRIVELCFWIVGVYFEPHYALARKIMTKVIALSSIIDDIYDAYGTIEELELFTLAMERFRI
ncbi:(-)-germacrene D synthase-like [Senna tora]|uniref:(-)-germacrene D synthase-like n=1 Tax=Senna tora TaxID=362788 RepID=A0A834WHF0_9FABA|nr:(-)-germacrene D synthase-like [Senna tora]